MSEGRRVEVFKSRQRWREMVKGERTMERSRGEVEGRGSNSKYKFSLT